jgi:mevalonate kinase
LELRGFPLLSGLKNTNLKTFYSNGKLLITGEYLVLDGANAFALPTKFGQNLIVKTGANKSITWTSYDSDNSIWFSDTLLFSEITDKTTPEIESVRTTLITILHEAFLLNPAFLNNAEGYEIQTQLTFPKKWGLGTSSTLLNNIAQWLGIDAFVLLKNSFGGSGYDIACAQNNSAIIYRLEQEKPIVEKIAFEPNFTHQLYFVYLNKKQNSKGAIASYYNKKNHNLLKTIAQNDKITQEVLEANSIQSFALAIDKHEASMSAILKMKTVKEEFFADFEGVVKSLGAWGGDFVLVISKQNPKNYFASKGFETIIAYDEMILKS